MELSEVARSVLLSSGWRSGRSVDVGRWRAQFAREGYTVPVRVLEFLAEFGGLEFRVPVGPGVQRAFAFHTDATRALDENFKENVDALADRVGVDLVPVGEAFQDYMVLLMDNDGRLFAALDNLLLLVGSSFPEALEHLVSGAQLSEVQGGSTTNGGG